MLSGMGRFLGKAAWLLAIGLTAGLAAAGILLTAQLRAPEVIRYIGGPGQLPYALAAAAAIALLVWLLLRCTRVRLEIVLAFWALLTAAFVILADTKQIVDFAYVCDAAQAFAKGDYTPLQGDYFHVYSYQLGTCLALEGLARLLPSADLNLMMQAVNALLSAGTAYVLAALSEELAEREEARRAALIVYMLFLPAALYCIHVYGTIPMLFFCSCAMLCLIRFMRAHRVGDALGYVVCAAIAYMLKPNAAVLLIAAVICALLHALQRRDIRPLLCALAGAALAVLLAKAAIWQYELRSGIVMRPDVSMLARLVMGLQDGTRGAGWYNGYTEQFFPASVSAAQEKAIALADLSARLEELGSDPVRTLIFVVQKAVSQWLEPTYGTLLYGNAAHLVSGYASSTAQAVFREESALRMALEAYMKAFQVAFYVLSAVGLCGAQVRRGDAKRLLLPVVVIGGFLYHMLFEAKSQYIYVYAICMIPLAAKGLYRLSVFIGDRCRKTRQ